MIDTKTIFEAQKASATQLFDLSGQTLQGVEQLTALNLQVTKTLLAEWQQDLLTALSARSPEDLIKLQTSLMQSAPQKFGAYVRHVQEIVTSASAAQRAAAEAQVADVQAKFVDAVNGALKSAPGSENAVALVQSAITAANKAYEGVNKASKQVSDAVASNVAKLSQAA